MVSGKIQRGHRPQNETSNLEDWDNSKPLSSSSPLASTEYQNKGLNPTIVIPSAVSINNFKDRSTISTHHYYDINYDSPVSRKSALSPLKVRRNF